MKAILIDGDKNLVWSEVPDPDMKDSEVLIDIHAAALNRADLLQREGNYPPPPGWPEWMGLEVSGTIAAVGKDAVGGWKVGDKVCALLGGGGYAEKIAVDPTLVMPIPEGISLTEAATLPEVFATVYLDLCLEGQLKEGETVLIHAAASGLGIAAVQIAKSIGAKVIASVGSDEKAEIVRGLGADIVINRKKDDIVEVMEKNPVDVAMDCVGGKRFGECIDKMAFGGRWIVIAALAGSESTIPVATLYKKSIRIIGITLRSRTQERKAFILSELVKNVWPKIETGAIRQLIHKVLPITEAEEAHAILQRNENIGKVVLELK